MPRPNWFIAFPLDGAFVHSLPPPPAGVRLFPASDVHLTLAFFGACGEAAANRAFEALDARLTAEALPATTVSLGTVEPMGPRRRYSALSALLDSGRNEVARAISSLRDPLCDAALGRRDVRPPKPHVTIGRPGRNASEVARAAGLDWARALDLRHVVARLDRLALYTWSEGNRRERLFRIVAELELAPHLVAESP